MYIGERRTGHAVYLRHLSEPRPRLPGTDHGRLALGASVNLSLGSCTFQLKVRSATGYCEYPSTTAILFPGLATPHPVGTCFKFVGASRLSALLQSGMRPPPQVGSTSRAIKPSSQCVKHCQTAPCDYPQAPRFPLPFRCRPFLSGPSASPAGAPEHHLHGQLGSRVAFSFKGCLHVAASTTTRAPSRSQKMVHTEAPLQFDPKIGSGVVCMLSESSRKCPALAKQGIKTWHWLHVPCSPFRLRLLQPPFQQLGSKLPTRLEAKSAPIGTYWARMASSSAQIPWP